MAQTDSFSKYIKTYGQRFIDDIVEGAYRVRGRTLAYEVSDIYNFKYRMRSKGIPDSQIDDFLYKATGKVDDLASVKSILLNIDDVTIDVRKFSEYALDPINSNGKHAIFESYGY